LLDKVEGASSAAAKVKKLEAALIASGDELDQETALKVPTDMLGRLLDDGETEALPDAPWPQEAVYTIAVAPEGPA
jgi:hypothetical protein